MALGSARQRPTNLCVGQPDVLTDGFTAPMRKTNSEQCGGICGVLRVERGKAHPHLNRKIYVLAALSTVVWKYYAAKTIFVAIIS